MCNALLKNFNIPSAKAIMIHKGAAYDTRAIENNIGLPCFVKPNRAGSSFGISKVSDKKFNEALKEAKNYSTEVIIEKSFNGPEYTVALLKGKPLTPLQILHDPIRGFYDYEAKYNSQNTQKIKIEDESTVKRLKEISEKVFDCLNCKTWARVDFVSEGEKLAVIEINSVPGFTAKSLFPLAAKYSGIEYKELISLIIEDC